jgi:hypothetical protein
MDLLTGGVRVQFDSFLLIYTAESNLDTRSVAT